jgi:hypothetical protein
VEDGREGIGDGGDAGGLGVDADEDVVEVEGAGEAGGDDREGEGAPL